MNKPFASDVCVTVTCRQSMNHVHHFDIEKSFKPRSKLNREASTWVMFCDSPGALFQTAPLKAHEYAWAQLVDESEN